MVSFSSLALALLISFSVGATSNQDIQTYADVVDISTSNVSDDLRILYGNGSYDFDFNSLRPSTNDNPYDSNFKFLCMYPYQSDLYLYLYHYQRYEDTPYELQWGTFYISFSTTSLEDISDQEDGQITMFEEDIKSYHADVLSFYGYDGRFFKLRINNLLNPSIQQRIYIDTCDLVYWNLDGCETFEQGSYITSSSLLIRDELEIDQTQGSTDLIYNYYKDDFVYIKNADVGCMLTPHGSEKKTDYWQDYQHMHYYKFDEDFFYFFSPDENHDIDELYDVIYDYTYLTYSAEVDITGNTWYCGSSDFSGSNANGFPKKCICYTGLRNGDLSGGYYNEDLAKKFGYNEDFFALDNAVDLNESFENGAMSQSETTRESVVQTSWKSGAFWSFQGWTHKFIVYSFPSIYKLSDLPDEDEYDSKDEYAQFYDFMRIGYNKGLSDNGEPYQWAFLITSDVRYVSTDSYYGSDKVMYNYSTCHEVYDATILWLHYRCGNQEFSLNAFSTPVSTSFTSTDVIYFDGVSANITWSGIWNSITSTFSNIGSSWWSSLKTALWVSVGIIGALLIALIIYLIIRWHNSKPNDTYYIGDDGQYHSMQTDVKNSKAESKAMRKELKHSNSRRSRKSKRQIREKEEDFIYPSSSLNYLDLINSQNLANSNPEQDRLYELRYRDERSQPVPSDIVGGSLDFDPSSEVQSVSGLPAPSIPPQFDDRPDFVEVKPRSETFFNSLKSDSSKLSGFVNRSEERVSKRANYLDSEIAPKYTKIYDSNEKKFNDRVKAKKQYQSNHERLSKKSDEIQSDVLKNASIIDVPVAKPKKNKKTVSLGLTIHREGDVVKSTSSKPAPSSHTDTKSSNKSSNKDDSFKDPYVSKMLESRVNKKGNNTK